MRALTTAQTPNIPALLNHNEDPAPARCADRGIATAVYRLKQRTKGAGQIAAAASTAIPSTLAGACMGGLGVLVTLPLSMEYVRAEMKTGVMSKTPFLTEIDRPSALGFEHYHQLAQGYSRQRLEEKTRAFYTRFSTKNFSEVGAQIGRLDDENLRTLYAYNKYLERGGRLNLQGASLAELCRKRDRYQSEANSRLLRTRELDQPSMQLLRERLTALTEALGDRRGIRFRADASRTQFPARTGPSVVEEDYQPATAATAAIAPSPESGGLPGGNAHIEFESFFAPYQEIILDKKHQCFQLEEKLKAGPTAGRMFDERMLEQTRSELHQAVAALVADMKQRVGQGAVFVFPQYLRTLSARFFLKAFDYPTLTKMVENGANILSVTFDEGRMLARRHGEADWTTREETLLSRLVEIPVDQQTDADRDFIAYALNRGVDVHFRPCDLVRSQRLHQISGHEVETHLMKTVNQRGWEESILYRAAQSFDLNTMKLLLDHQADPKGGRYKVKGPTWDNCSKRESSVLHMLCTRLGQRQALTAAEVKACCEVVQKMRAHGLRVDHHSAEARDCAGRVGNDSVANLILNALKA
jgi:hypothetical protein